MVGTGGPSVRFPAVTHPRTREPRVPTLMPPRLCHVLRDKPPFAPASGAGLCHVLRDKPFPAIAGLLRPLDGRDGRPARPFPCRNAPSDARAARPYPNAPASLSRIT